MENGPSAHYASFFDIDWRPVKAELEGKVLLPILGEQYGTVVENQEIILEYDRRTVLHSVTSITSFPLIRKHSAMILALRLDELISRTQSDDLHVQELQSILTALRHLPDRNEADPAQIAERYREKEIIRRRLSRIMNESQTVQTFIQDNVAIYNGTKGDSKSFDLLDQLLSYQVYRLAYWRVASEEINYRRFFDINELAAIRMEDPAVFLSSHQLILQLLKKGAATGLRIDHVDGLYDPSTYLGQLQTWAKTNLAPPAGEAERPLFLVVEKILSREETLPVQWPVYGTTGYDFLTLVNGLFVDGSHEQAFDGSMPVLSAITFPLKTVHMKASS